MKLSHKEFLKTLLLTSVTSIGGSQTSMAASAPIVAISKDEMTGDNTANENLASTLSSSVLSPGTSFSEITGHQSHSSHSSHKSHVSSSGGGYQSSFKGAAIAGGAVLGGAVLYYVIHKIVKSHKQHKANRAQRLYQENATYSSYGLGTRDLSSGTYGADLNEMIDSLISNDVLSHNDLQYTKQSNRFYKYNSKVKKSVKRMQRRMGYPITGVADVKFQINLKQWKNVRTKYNELIASDTININENQEALTAVAILLVEKGYMKEYNIDSITTPTYKNLILDAYHDFLKKHNIPISDDINFEILNILYNLPTKQ